jgi:hypothetical protein
MCADIECLREELQNFLRRGVGGDIVVCGLAMEKDVTNAAPDEEGLVAVVLERVANRIGEVPGIHGMIMRLWREVNEVEEV